MKAVKYLKTNGIKHAIEVLWEYKIEIILEKIVLQLTKRSELRNTIVIESHNDFDCNGGAFYNYLIKNKYNEKYRIVWLIRYKVKHKLPDNVTTVYLHKPSFKKAYYMCTAKYFTYDCEIQEKRRKDQIAVYCSHGAGGLKKVKGKINIPDSFDYILVLSDTYAPIQAEECWSLHYPDKRFVSIGYPAYDCFFDGKQSDAIKKLNLEKYGKIILWMPTFRCGGGYNRNDSTKEQKMGIPLIEDMRQYEKLNSLLKENNSFLIIKIHPKQNLYNLAVMDMSNIKIVTGMTVKELQLDSYQLMKGADALISDYSGAAYEYLHLDRPVAYVLDDMNDYKPGFVVDDIHTLLAGAEIYNINDLYNFISDVCNEKDDYVKRRKEIREQIYQYFDSGSCERLARLLEL